MVVQIKIIRKNMTSEEVKLKLLQKLIQTENGWKKIAYVIKNSVNVNAKNELEKMLNDISGDSIVIFSGVPKKLSDILLETLNYYLDIANKFDSITKLLNLSDEELLQTIPHSKDE
jgi:hypothetical protein